MTNEVIDILLKVKAEITHDSDVTWTRFDNAEALMTELNGFISRLNQGDSMVIEDIYFHFLPTSTFQELSMQNGWADEYVVLAERFDAIYKRYKYGRQTH